MELLGLLFSGFAKCSLYRTLEGVHQGYHLKFVIPFQAQ